MSKRQKRLLAISSGGGHWVQMLRLKAAFAGCAVTYASVRDEYALDVPFVSFVKVPDATRWDRIKFLKMVVAVAFLIIRIRPDVVLTTGAAPGFVAIRIARFIGAKTIWVDSIANVDEMSLSGKKAKRYADLWLTQWEHLAVPDGPIYRGTVLS